MMQRYKILLKCAFLVKLISDAVDDNVSNFGIWFFSKSWAVDISISHASGKRRTEKGTLPR